ncbi:hypothetical protein H5410_056118 [Solanum commersonii]|uniref:Uncharacterized protein n=1 Tax=Solanum commersonii TaxID=4109 RepID=A0A9J5WLS7_SOLCO|nr:hypothetical protein H5410_056118 [Solanum commersonii]
MTKEVFSPYGVNMWRSIRALWDDFKIKTKDKVRNGEKTSFWGDDWHEMGILRNIYPDIHNLMLNQQRTIAGMWTPDGWEISFRRQVNDWEITRVADFLNTIGHFKGTQEGEDELWWQGSDRGTFKVGKAYIWLNSHNQQNVHWPWKTIWKENIPYKERLQRPFKVGKKLGFWQEADVDGESYQPAYGGQSGRREILGVLRT